MSKVVQAGAASAFGSPSSFATRTFNSLIAAPLEFSVYV